MAANDKDGSGLSRRALVRGGASAAVIGKPGAEAREDPLSALWPRWLAARRRLDQLTGEQCEVGLEERALCTLTYLLLVAPTNTTTGVAIKLRALLELAPIECGDAEDFPWPQVRLILDCLSGIDGA